MRRAPELKGGQVMIKLTRRYRVSPNLWGLRETDAGKSFISLLESRMHLIDARTVREQRVSSNPGPRVSEITKG